VKQTLPFNSSAAKTKPFKNLKIGAITWFFSVVQHPRLTFFSLAPKLKNIGLGGKLVWIGE
jgi:hypothetical protein